MQSKLWTVQAHFHGIYGTRWEKSRSVNKSASVHLHISLQRVKVTWTWIMQRAGKDLARQRANNDRLICSGA